MTAAQFWTVEILAFGLIAYLAFHAGIEKAEKRRRNQQPSVVPVVVVAEPDDETPLFDQMADDHPWITEQMFAHELRDETAIRRWLA